MNRALPLLATIFLFTAAILSAQHCPPRNCCAGSSLCPKSAAARAAAQDDRIVRRVNRESGEVTYARQSVCPVTGKPLFTTVEYCLKSGRFINISPADRKACRKSKILSDPAPANRKGLVNKEKPFLTDAQRAACFGALARTIQRPTTPNTDSPSGTPAARAGWWR